MVCLGLMTITTLDYCYATRLSHDGGFVIWIMFRTNNVLPTDEAGVYDWSIMSIIRSC